MSKGQKSEARASVVWPFTPVARNLEIVSADGAYLIDADGRRILDAAGGAIVTNIGHGRESVARAVYDATKSTTYVVPPWLTPQRRALIERLRADWLPPRFDHIHLTCGGSEGVETAMKIAIQHHAANGAPQRNKIIGRSVSYHGTTLATTAVGGHTARKKGLAHVLDAYPSVPTPYPLRCPLGPHHPRRGTLLRRRAGAAHRSRRRRVDRGVARRTDQRLERWRDRAAGRLLARRTRVVRFARNSADPR